MAGVAGWQRVGGSVWVAGCAGLHGVVAVLVAPCLPVTVTVTPWAAGDKPGDVQHGSSAMMGRGGRGGGANFGTGTWDRDTPAR